MYIGVGYARYLGAEDAAWRTLGVVRGRGLPRRLLERHPEGGGVDRENMYIRLKPMSCTMIYRSPAAKARLN